MSVIWSPSSHYLFMSLRRSRSGQLGRHGGQNNRMKPKCCGYYQRKLFQCGPCVRQCSGHFLYVLCSPEFSEVSMRGSILQKETSKIIGKGSLSHCASPHMGLTEDEDGELRSWGASGYCASMTESHVATCLMNLLSTGLGPHHSVTFSPLCPHIW